MSTICPKDGTACIDDLCRGSGVCLQTGAEMWDRCDRCHGIYSQEYGVECACEPGDDYPEEDDHDCIEWNSGGVCAICRRPLSIEEQTKGEQPDPPSVGETPERS